MTHAGEEVALCLVGGIRGINSLAESLLDLLVFSDFFINIFKACDNSGFSSGKVELRKLQTVVAYSGLKDPSEKN